MNRIIADDLQLRAYIPNILVTVDGEQTLFEKISSQLSASEEWLEARILGSLYVDVCEGVYPDIFVAASTFIANDALGWMLGHLDIVLTPNGFGVVANNTIAPASKERVAALKKNISSVKGRALDTLLHHLCQIDAWRTSSQFEWHTSSWIQSLSDAEYSFSKFLSLRRSAMPYEMEIAERWIGQELSIKLRKLLAQPNLTYPVGYVVEAINNIVIRATQEHRLDIRALSMVVDIIRHYKDVFPEWFASDVAKLFDPPIFENKRSSGGYFF